MLSALAYVSKWEKLRDQDYFRRPWPVRRRDAHERPGASNAAASAESVSGSSDAQGDSEDTQKGDDDSGDGADASKVGKLPREKKRGRVALPKNRFQQERKEQQQGALVPTRIADTKVVALQ